MGHPPSEPLVLEIEAVPATFRLWAGVAVVLGLAALAYALGADAIGVAVFTPLFLALVGFVWWNARRNAGRRHDIVIDGDSMSLLRLDREQRESFDVRSLDALEIREGRVFVGVGGVEFRYPRTSVIGGDAAFERFVARVRAHLLALDPACAEAFDEAREQYEKVGTSAASYTRAIITVLCAVYVVAYVGGLYDSDADLGPRLVRVGGNLPALVRGGAWYRLFTANLLHVGFTHVFLNALAIAVVGSTVERVLGGWSFGAIYLVSGVAGALGSTLASNTSVTVGASTSIFGLFAAWGYLSLAFADEVPRAWRMTTAALILLVLQLVAGLVLPGIDFYAHVGGAVGGLLVVFVLTRRGPESVRRDPPMALRWAMLAWLAAYAAAVVAAVVAYVGH